MQALFVSDCHLCASQPDTITCFKRFLQNEARAADAVYILGDLFEYWIGDDDDNDEYTGICDALKALSEHTPVACMRGNRDLVLGPGFERRSGCRLLPDEYKLNLDGVEILLMHGDLLCTDDHALQRFRRTAQNPLVQGVFTRLPLAWRRQLAKRMRHKSTQVVKSNPPSIMDVNNDAVADAVRKHGVDWLIHGHTHMRDEHTVNLGNGRTAKRIVLGAWHPYDKRMGSALAVTNGQIKWLEL